MNTDAEALNGITEAITGCAYRIANGMGSGFLEKVHENAMAHESRKVGLEVIQQHQIVVVWDGVIAGEYVADPIVNGKVVVEIKAPEEIHSAQCINDLTATGLPICLLINFAPKVQVKRFVRGGLELGL